MNASAPCGTNALRHDSVVHCTLGAVHVELDTSHCVRGCRGGVEWTGKLHLADRKEKTGSGRWTASHDRIDAEISSGPVSQVQSPCARAKRHIDPRRVSLLYVVGRPGDSSHQPTPINNARGHEI